MPTFRNISPLGALDYPLIGREGGPIGELGTGCLEPDETFDVDEDMAKILSGLPDVFAPVPVPLKKEK